MSVEVNGPYFFQEGIKLDSSGELSRLKTPFFSLKGNDMSNIQYVKFRKAWGERKRREERDVSALQAILIEKVKVCANEIKKLGGKRVILFGSLAAGRFRKGSDVDIAVEGLTVKAYFRALGVVEDILGEVPFDLVDLKEALPSVKEKVEKEGILIG